MHGVAIIGAGTMGKTRARVVRQSENSRIVMVTDTDAARGCELAQSSGAEFTPDWEMCIRDPRVGVVVICTPPKFHAHAAIAALDAGKHVLCEKPLARSVREASVIADAAEYSGCVLKTGFNYRYLEHVRQAKEMLNENVLGPSYFLRCRYGHGGRPGYERHWCTDRELSGGGVLLEQGIHIIDLVRFLLGEPARVMGCMQRYFWDSPEVEDNSFVLLESENNQTAQIHMSWTQWRNIFQLEIFGRDGSLELTGRDGHYGPPKLTWMQRKSDHSRPDETVFEYSEENTSWELEWADFISAVEKGTQPMGNINDSVRALQIVEAAYASSVAERWVNVSRSNELIESTP